MKIVIADSIRLYSWTDKRCVVELTNPKFDEFNLDINKRYRVVSLYGKSTNKFKVYTRALLGQSALHECKFEGEYNKVEAFLIEDDLFQKCL